MIDRSVISQLTTFSTRSDVLAWYVTSSALGSSIGSEASGRIIHTLEGRGWTQVEAYHALFWIFAAAGCINTALVLMLDEACELQTDTAYTQLPTVENEQVDETSQRNDTTPSRAETSWGKTRSWIARNFSAISRPTRSIMYKLWFLLAVDSLADGMVPYSLTNYYMDIKFHPAKSTLGDVTSASYFLAAIGSAFAGPLARKLGLINTMVFTHVPSSSAVLVFPFPNAFWMTAGLLLVRAGLNNMDQAPRAAFIAAVVKPEERTAAMGITSMLRTLASMAGPTLTGVMAANEQFWIAFVVAGLCRLIYDFGLYALFVNMVIDPQDGKAEVSTGEIDSGADEVEMRSLVSEDSDGKSNVDGAAESTATYANSLQPPANPRARSRSPHRSVATD
jgi:Major Facilitator Superfamily